MVNCTNLQRSIPEKQIFFPRIWQIYQNSTLLGIKKLSFLFILT